MTKENNTIVKFATIGNIGHIMMVFITIFAVNLLEALKPLNIYNGIRSIILVLIFFLTLFFWFYIGVLSTKNNKENIYRTGILTGLISILPAAFFTILCQVFSSSLQGASQFKVWNTFYFLGGPTLFWHRPFAFIGELIMGSNLEFNAYIMLNINLIVIIATVFSGAIFFGKKRERTSKNIYKEEKITI